VADNEQGAIQGALASLGSIAGFFGPILSTALFGFFIGPNAPVQLPGAGFFLGALLIVVSLLVALRAIARHPPQPGRKPATPAEAAPSH
jgi:DHA1 family tetracycline resistance protein-like MFS transporter